MNAADIEMAKQLGISPRTLIANNSSTHQQRWKAPTREWVRDMYEDRFGSQKVKNTKSATPTEPRTSSTDGQSVNTSPAPMNQTEQDLKHVEIYTDGACTGNPGPGGYGVVLKYGEKRREISGGYRRTTNNRMELTAAIVGLETLRYRCRVTLFTDSRYLADGITKGWARRWRANGWMRGPDAPAINPDLWGRLLDLCDAHDVTFVWVKGHAGHIENECCDQLSVSAAARKDLPVDQAYELVRA